MKSLQLTFATTIARFAGWLSHALLGKSGETIAGRVLLILCPSAISKLAAGRKIILVSATNGKTSTTRALAGFMATSGSVTTSKSGSNLSRGVANALMTKSDYAVLEVDELHLPAVAKATKPQAILLLNLTRDQLHRMHEVKRVADRWKEMAESSNATFIADIDDPFVNYVISSAKKSVRVSFGGAAGRHPDGAVCPSCGAYLDWQGGLFKCGCGLNNHYSDKQFEADSAALRNEVLANVTAERFGVPWHEVDVASLERKVSKKYISADCSIRLTKNPASWREALAGVSGEKVILILNAREVDGIDTSWLWDVDFSSLRGKHVVVTGERGIDLAYRLHCEGVVAELVADFDAAAAKFAGPVEVLAAYTAFFELVG
ncbi:MAG: MurT ligase domain-containing protein [Actinomycetes bacterium]